MFPPYSVLSQQRTVNILCTFTVILKTRKYEIVLSFLKSYLKTGLYIFDSRWTSTKIFKNAKNAEDNKHKKVSSMSFRKLAFPPFYKSRDGRKYYTSISRYAMECTNHQMLLSWDIGLSREQYWLFQVKGQRIFLATLFVKDIWRHSINHNTVSNFSV